jgi:tetratricopeptide (TPR) repeat protein
MAVRKRQTLLPIRRASIHLRPHSGSSPVAAMQNPTRTDPPQVGPLLARATQLLQAGRPGDAVVPLREAARWLPGNAAILHDLGLACLECGRIGEAVTALQNSVAVDPSFQDSHLRLGIAFEAAGAADAALAAYHAAAELKPLPEANYRAANLLDNLGHTSRAIEMFRRAAGFATGTTLGRIAMARALLAEDRDAEAEKVLRKVLATEPDSAVALDLLGNRLADAGRFAEARRYFLRAIEKAPLLAGSYYDAARCGRIGPEDTELIARMRIALESQRLEPAQKIRVHLALGKAADDLGNYEAAMRHFDAAETLRNAIIRFDLAKFEARVDGLIAYFTPELPGAQLGTQLARAPATGLDDSTPILILGLPRSGTTLVEQILSAHPDVSAGGELSFWNERGSAWERAGSVEEKAQSLSSSAADYLRLLQSVASGAARVTDKMPLNFQWAGLIHLALPRATLIHCRRSPLDTALSIHQTHFNPRMWFPTGGTALVGYVRAYQRLCAHWRRVLPPERFIEIDYEALVDEPEPVIRRIVNACGLTWNSACLFPERNARAVKTPSKWQARQPIYRSAVGRWHSYEPWLGPLGALRD